MGDPRRWPSPWDWWRLWQRRRHRRSGIQTADDGQLVAPGRQRLVDEAQPHIPPFRGRYIRTAVRPISGRPAVRRKNGREAGLGSGRGLRQGRLRRNHGIQQRQRQRHADSAQETTPGNIFLAQVHGYASFCCIRFRLLAGKALLLFHVHVERRALHDAQDQRRKTIIVTAGVAHDRANHRHVLIFNPAP